MSTKEFKALEKLIGRLQAECGGPINITYPIIQDGFGLAVYEDHTGILVASATQDTLERAFIQLKHKAFVR